MSAAGASRSRKSFSPFWGYCYSITSVRYLFCPRDKRLEFRRYRIQNLEMTANLSFYVNAVYFGESLTLCMCGI